MLGYSAARNLGIGTLTAATQLYLDDRYFTVIGVLQPVDVAPEIDDAAPVSFPIADRELGLARDQAVRINVRADPDQVAAVAAVLPFAASPAQPEAVEVCRLPPTEALRAL